MKRLFAQRPGEPPLELELEAERGRVLLEESRELVVVLDSEERVVAASRRARASVEGVEEGRPLPPALLRSTQTFAIPYELEGRRETLVYLRDPGDLAAYEELRAGFTAAVSHELRTPLARLLVLLESASLPGAQIEELIELAREEIDQIRELIDDILFLSELETGREVVALERTKALPILQEVVEGLADAAARAGVTLRAEGEEGVELPLRPRLLATIASNLGENAIHYAGPGSTFTLSVHLEDGSGVLTASDDGVGVSAHDLPRLFERFYRADHARASRGTGLGLAIVKHAVAAAGGTVEAAGGRGQGLTVRCAFPA